MDELAALLLSATGGGAVAVAALGLLRSLASWRERAEEHQGRVRVAREESATAVVGPLLERLATTEQTVVALGAEVSECEARPCRGQFCSERG